MTNIITYIDKNLDATFE